MRWPPPVVFARHGIGAGPDGEEAEAAIELEKLAQMNGFNFEEENDFDFDAVDNILELNETTFPFLLWLVH
jgi:hypothetical protein